MLTNDDFKTTILTAEQIDAATKRAHALRSETFMSVMSELGEAVLELFSMPVRITEKASGKVGTGGVAHATPHGEQGTCKA